VVAPLGTGLTSDQAELLKRHTGHVILLYDSDEAGLRATFRAGDELLHHGLRVSVATLPEGEDPDTLVQREGGAALERVLRDAIDVFDRKLQILDARGMFGTIPGRRRALDRLLPTIRAASDPLTRDLYITRAAEAAHIRKETLEREAQVQGSGIRRQVSGTAISSSSAAPPPAAPPDAERALILALLAGEPWTSRVLESVSAEVFEYPSYRKVFEAIRQGTQDALEGDAAAVLEHLMGLKLDAASVGDVVEAAIRDIRARPLTERLESFDRRISLASPEEQRVLIEEKKKAAAERNAVKPTYKITSRRKGAPGS
ncbi:MAG TPA: toprim domain-containing protein, partial [Gemmatimonadales bacterium]|nr:toprim domain-containing protein [Gemmatimonadales bacterium]